MKKTIMSLAAMLSLLCAIDVNATPQDKNAQDMQALQDSIRTIKAKADAGDPEALNRMGNMYYYGKIVKQDLKQAYNYWAAAAAKNNPSALVSMGMCYRYGQIVPKDSLKAARLYKQAIIAGNPSLVSQIAKNAVRNAFEGMLLGECYANGIGVPKDLAKADTFYALAAVNGSPQALQLAGLNRLNAKDGPGALKYFDRGRKRGDLMSTYWMGCLLLGDLGPMGVTPDAPQGVVYVLKAAEGGYAPAQNEMGELYSAGHGVSRNTDQAAMWYQRAAKQGHPSGLRNYALALKDGLGVPQDYDAALRYLAQWVIQGHQKEWKQLMHAIDSVGSDPFGPYVHAMKAYLVDNDMARASQLFKAAEGARTPQADIMYQMMMAMGNNAKGSAQKAVKTLETMAETQPEAAYCLATLYEQGQGVAKDMTKAISLYQQAADAGYGKALCYLGDIYYEGRGTNKDLIKAVGLYRQALEQNEMTRNGAVRLADCFENGVAGLPPNPGLAKKLQAISEPASVVEILNVLD